MTHAISTLTRAARSGERGFTRGLVIDGTVDLIGAHTAASNPIQSCILIARGNSERPSNLQFMLVIKLAFKTWKPRNS